MKQREQALLLLRKATQDEALVDEVLESQRVADDLLLQPDNVTADPGVVFRIRLLQAPGDRIHFRLRLPDTDYRVRLPVQPQGLANHSSLMAP